ncbi:MAG: hypothetical protein A2Y17_13425 [Clostridiales bacterium GWF2_38_85]|nr:MAG: hypothetical protein A2Y17_13425 [Clostridiales bacterium GWF2_38_85]
MENNTHAVGQLQGYLLQVRHMLFELISLDDITVSVESLDDVAIQSEDGSICAEQIKSVTSSNNPIADRSVVFWKTLYNWHDYITNGSLSLDKTIFKMIVVANKEIASGTVAESFSNSIDEATAREVFQAARKTLWGEKEELKSDVPESYSKYLEKLFAPENAPAVINIIRKMSVEVHENDYDDKLRAKFNRIPALISEFSDALLIFMLGWVNEKVNEQGQQGQAALIKSSEFNTALQAQMRMYNQRDAIPALSQAIDDSAVRIEVNQQDVYIQQLDLIESDFDSKLEAASEYLRTSAEKTMRAEKGLFTPQSLNEYTEAMKQLWNNKRRLVELANTDTDVTKGKRLYLSLRESAINQKLQGNEVPIFFGTGTLQTLANAPKNDPSIGWHSQYKELLKTGGGQNE